MVVNDPEPPFIWSKNVKKSKRRIQPIFMLR